jgi:uncharacterized protein with HEPN domain
MPHEKTDLKYIWDMLDAARTLIEITRSKSLSDYESDKIIRLSVERSIEIIGEAARRVSEPFQLAHPAIAWRAIIATRHVIAHEYGDLKHDKIWRIAVSHVPGLVALLAPIIEANPPGADTTTPPPP